MGCVVDAAGADQQFERDALAAVAAAAIEGGLQFPTAQLKAMREGAP